MIKRLRTKLITASMASLIAVLAVIIGAFNILYFHRMISSADTLLEMLADNGGRFPDRPEGDFGEGGSRPGDEEEKPENRKTGVSAQTPPQGLPSARGNDSLPFMAGRSGLRRLFEGGLLDNRELLFESRFFSVRFDREGSEVSSDISNISAITGETALACARSVLEKSGAASGGSVSGFFDSYRYLAKPDGDGTLIVFLDCQREISDCRAILLFSAAAALLGALAVLLILIPVSARIVKPFAENYEKQRRFITDAGHELRTPITIINADTDVLAMEAGESEWTGDIRVQTKRLAELTDDLIFLSRAEEDLKAVPMIELPFSDLVRETAASFEAPARTKGKSFALEIDPMITVKGDEKGLRHLVAILMDNAVKYSPEGGEIRLFLKEERNKSRAVLTVSNTTAAPISDETLRNMFDRFYRADSSRNSAAGGYGIGLSIARAVVMQHKGSISAARPGGPEEPGLTVTVMLPL